MVKSRSVTSAGTLKSPSSNLTSKPDKDKDAEKEKMPGSTTERSQIKTGGASFKQMLSTRELRSLAKKKQLGGKAWEAAKAKIRMKLAPPEHKNKSARANTAMPVRKLKTRIQESAPKDKRVTTPAGVCLAAILDYAVSELVDNACQACELAKHRTITARHIKMGVPQDESLAQLFRGVTIPQGGTIPMIHAELAQGYRKRKMQPQAWNSKDSTEKSSKELSSPSGYHEKKMGKKGISEAKPSSGDDTSIDPKKDKPGASSSSPAEK